MVAKDAIDAFGDVFVLLPHVLAVVTELLFWHDFERIRDFSVLCTCTSITLEDSKARYRYTDTVYKKLARIRGWTSASYGHPNKRCRYFNERGEERGGGFQSWGI
jgi:hypothetical protein